MSDETYDTDSLAFGFPFKPQAGSADRFLLITKVDQDRELGDWYEVECSQCHWRTSGHMSAAVGAGRAHVLRTLHSRSESAGEGNQS